MMLRVFCLWLCLPAQALALSCLPYGVTDAYHAADAAPEPYLIVLGALDFDEDRAPRSHQSDTPPLTEIPARVRGHQMGANAQRVEFKAPVLLRVSCVGPWCARVEPGKALMFLKRTDAGFELQASPCGAFLFRAPLPEDLTTVQSCLDGRACVPKGLP